MVIDIWEGLDYSSADCSFRPTMETYVIKSAAPRGAVLILPGGGYGFTSPREAEPIALQYNAAGFHAFVLYYSVSPNIHPQPLLDASRAMCIIRENAQEWLVNPNDITAIGFSAGGHLAASLGVHWNKEYLLETKGLTKDMNKPNRLILSYPVITSSKFTHGGSFKNLLGSKMSDELLEEMSLEKQIGSHTPPCFIWHTYDDGAVPVENAMLFAEGLRRHDIPFELHIYAKGPHGISLANEETRDGDLGLYPHVATWLNLSVEWLKGID